MDLLSISDSSDDMQCACSDDDSLSSARTVDSDQPLRPDITRRYHVRALDESEANKGKPGFSESKLGFPSLVCSPYVSRMVL